MRLIKLIFLVFVSIPVTLSIAGEKHNGKKDCADGKPGSQKTAASVGSDKTKGISKSASSECL